MNIDSLKLRIGHEYLEWYNKDCFLTNEQFKASEPNEKTIISKLDVEKGLLGLKDITINQSQGYLTFEVSAKMLKENYFKLINPHTAENLIYNINQLGIIRLNYDLINTAEVLRCDVTDTLILNDEKEIKRYLESLSVYKFNNKYKCSVYQNESIVFDRNVKTNSLREHLTFYHKYPEIKRDTELLKYIDIDESKNMLRCESKYGCFKQMRTAFKVDNLKFSTVLESSVPTNLNILNRITAVTDEKELILIKDFGGLIGMKRKIKPSKILKTLGMLSILKMCNNNIDMVKIYLATNSTANNSKSLREFKAVLKSKRESETDNTIQNDITEIRNYLRVG